MLSKRIFWLTCAAIASWLIWMRLRQRQDEFAASTPQFAPPRTFAPLTPAEQPAPLPAPDAASATASPAIPLAASNEELAAPLATPLPELDEVSAAPAPSPADSTDSAADMAEAIGSADVEITGYCMRCKTKRPIQNAHRETTESGRPAARGTCPVCGANMFTFLSTDDT